MKFRAVPEQLLAKDPVIAVIAAHLLINKYGKDKNTENIRCPSLARREYVSNSDLDHEVFAAPSHFSARRSL